MDIKDCHNHNITWLHNIIISTLHVYISLHVEYNILRKCVNGGAPLIWGQNYIHYMYINDSTYLMTHGYIKCFDECCQVFFISFCMHHQLVKYCKQKINHIIVN